MAVFYSFHYERDAFRVQQILQMGAVEGQTILNAQDWESVKRQGPRAIEAWIDKQMAYKAAVVVLVGARTASRPWVRYEIEKAWNEKRPLVGIRIHGLADGSGVDRPGPDPFAAIRFDRGGSLADYVTLHDPVGFDSKAVYASIKSNLKVWVDGAYRRS